VYGAYRACRRRKRATRNAQRYEVGLLAACRAQDFKTRLRHAPAETGLPIGNLTSQFFANVDLNELDQFVKHTLKCRYYVRYVDDMVLLDPDPAVLVAWREQIAAFLLQRLGLHLRNDDRLQPVANGIDFLGYVLRPDYRLVRQRVVTHLRQKLDHYERSMATGATWRLPPDTQPLRAMLASYLGHFRHANAHRLVASLWQRYPWLTWVLRLSEARRLLRVDVASSATSLHGQWRYFRRRFPQACVLMQVGNRVEMYGSDAQHVRHWNGRGAVPVVRVGWAGQAGVSWRWQQREALLRDLTQRGLAWVDVAQRGWTRAGKKQRVLRSVHLSTTGVGT
jgi:hypothetical protein